MVKIHASNLNQLLEGWKQRRRPCTFWRGVCTSNLAHMDASGLSEAWPEHTRFFIMWDTLDPWRRRHVTLPLVQPLRRNLCIPNVFSEWDWAKYLSWQPQSLMNKQPIAVLKPGHQGMFRSRVCERLEGLKTWPQPLVYSCHPRASFAFCMNNV